QGQLQWHRKVLDALWPQTDLSGFMMHPDGGFVVGGAVWTAVKFPEAGIDFGPHGGYFLLRLTPEGKIAWHQTIRNTNYRGSRLSNSKVALAVNPRGTIFMAFNHLEGITFSEKERSPEYPPPADQRLSSPAKSVLAAYSPKGKRLWVRYSGENVTAYALAANKNRVFQSLRIHQPNPYGLSADTSA
ncbi:MAG TPA: hypothetical protein VK927_01210, partial [Adhaeribacter sp.]|nr:hypothetical protein [Adhaeribacter sp.]